MRAEDAAVFTAALAIIPKFPSWSQPAIEAIAELVGQWCETPQDAQKLVGEAIRTLPEWPGPQGLKAIYDGLFAVHDQRSWDTPQSWQDDANAGSFPCNNCNRLGVIPGREELYDDWRLCSCANARSAGQYLRSLNRQAALNRDARTKRLSRRKFNPVPVAHEPVAVMRRAMESAVKRREPEPQWDDEMPFAV